MARLRVVLAEDHYLVREGTRRLLEDSGEVDVIASVGTAAELLDAARRLRPDAVLTDIRMPPEHRMEGIEAAHRLRCEQPGIGVVVLSQHSEPAYALELFKNGTTGLAYLLKSRVGDLGQLLLALREAAAGRSVVDSEIVEGLVARSRGSSPSPLASLSPREVDVLRRMAQGRTNRAIAEEMFLSVSSVEKYVNSIFTRLGLIPEFRLDRRVLAVLAFLDRAGE